MGKCFNCRRNYAKEIFPDLAFLFLKKLFAHFSTFVQKNPFLKSWSNLANAAVQVKLRDRAALQSDLLDSCVQPVQTGHWANCAKCAYCASAYCAQREQCTTAEEDS